MLLSEFVLNQSATDVFFTHFFRRNSFFDICTSISKFLFISVAYNIEGDSFKSIIFNISSTFLFDMKLRAERVEF